MKNLSLSRGLRLVSVAFFTVLLRLVSRNPLFPTSETRLRNIFSTLTETSLRDLFMFLLRPVSQMLFPSPTETGLGNLFFTLLRLVSVTLFLFYAETYLLILFKLRLGASISRSVCLSCPVCPVLSVLSCPVLSGPTWSQRNLYLGQAGAR